MYISGMEKKMTPPISYRELERIKSNKEKINSTARYAGSGSEAPHACSCPLPLTGNADRGLPGRRSDNADIRDGNATVLVVDDDPGTRQLFCEILEDFGYRALAVSDALSALAAIETTSEVKLVITDHRMPDMSGLEFAAILRKQRPGVPVILLTACASIENYLLSQDLGVFEFVDKSVTKGEFARIVRSALEAQETE